MLTRRSMLGALAAAALPAAAHATPRDPAAALWSGIDLQGQDGRVFQMHDLRTPVTLLHLWANWCPACLGEMGSLAAATSALGDRQVEIVMVSHPQFWAADQAFARRHALPFRLATPAATNDPAVVEAALLGANGAYVVPRSLAFGPGGRGGVWNHEGALSWSSPDTIARLRTIAAG